MPDAPDDTPAPAGKEPPRFTRAQLTRAGAAVGIGSAALVAALLYAKSRQKQGSKKPPRDGFTD